jgi:xanthine dehydrogenase YagT iron-sulfur-binding subunit
MPKPDEPNGRDPNDRPDKKRLGRRDFVKMVGGTGVAVSAAGALIGEALLPRKAEAQPAAPPAVAAPGKVMGPAAVPITLHINGEDKNLTVEPRVTLLDALRDRLDITGAKRVCDRGTCGACTVIINKKAVYSCTILAIDAASSGAHIETIESLAPEGQLHPLSQAFVDQDGQQCGFCTPGFVMAAKAYLDEHPHPTYDDVKAALGGNLCRCGTYMGVRRAVVQAGGGTVPGQGGA